MGDKKEKHSGVNLAPNKLYLLITIVQKGKGTFFSDVIKTYESNLQISVVGRGTAHSDLIEFLGLKENRRSVVFSVIQEDKLTPCMEALEDKFHSIANDTGIAFAIPFSSMIGKLSYGFLSNDERLAGGNTGNG